VISITCEGKIMLTKFLNRKPFGNIISGKARRIYILENGVDA
jgi:hypothetical protein